MKTKIFIIGIAIAFVTTAYAVVSVTFNIPDAYAINHMLPAFTAHDGARVMIEIEVHAPNPDDEYRAHYGFRLPARKVGDSDVVYGKKRIGIIIDAFVQAHKQKLGEDIQRAYYQNAPTVDINEPDPNNLN